MHHLFSHLTNSSFWKDECKLILILATQESRFKSRCSVQWCVAVEICLVYYSFVFCLKYKKYFDILSFMDWFYYPLTHTNIWRKLLVGSRESCECVWIVTESLWWSLSPILPRTGADLANNSGWEEHSCSGRLRGSKKLSLGANKR